MIIRFIHSTICCMYTGCPLHFIKLKLPQLSERKDAVSFCLYKHFLKGDICYAWLQCEKLHEPNNIPLKSKTIFICVPERSARVPKIHSHPHYGCKWDASLRDVMLHVISLVKLHCQWVSSRGHMRLSVDCNM